MTSSRPMLAAVSFVSGFAIMAAEMSAGRLVAPYYGTSTMVWALLIGTVMLSLALGNLLGGRLSRRGSAPIWLFGSLLASATLLALLPTMSRPLMGGALASFTSGASLVLLLTAAAVALLLALPLVCLGAVSPILVHEAAAGRSDTGEIAGRLYALGTLGSLLGTFLPGILLVPALGSAATLRLAAGVLAAFGVTGLLRGRLRLLAAVPLVACVAWASVPPTTIKPRRHVVLERESAHNFLQVTDDGRERRLYLNDGYAVQSVFPLDGSFHLESVWGYYAAAPGWTTHGRPERILLLGLGGGSAARFFAAALPQGEITGVELDPAVAEVAATHFGLPPSTRVVIEDARAFVERTGGLYDLIIVDAFRFPYVPFQLTTQEFFVGLDRHLAPGGVVMLNVGRDGRAYDVVDAVARTLGTVFQNVAGVDVPNGANTILVATRHSLARVAGLERLEVGADVRRRLERLTPLRPWQRHGDAPILTDERAPVELLTDGIVLRRLLGLEG